MFKHLKENNMSYFEHMLFALTQCKESAMAMAYFFIHAFFPDLLITSGSQKIIQINNNIHNK